MLAPLAALVLSSLAHATLDHPAMSVLEDPAAAQAFDYCAAPAPSEALDAAIDTALSPDSDGVSEYETAAALLVRAGLQIAQASETQGDCRSAFTAGARTFDRRLTRNTRRLRGQAARDRSSDPAIAEVQQGVAAQWLADQAGRLTYVELQTSDRTGAAFWAQRLATAHAVTTDADSTLMMRDVLERYDWIDSHRFGGRVAAHAWILVQHADDHPDFQAEALDRMAGYLDSGGVRQRDYAYLFDRVAVNTGALQRYGTQPADQCNEDGSLDLKPVEDPGALDERRATMGLGPYLGELEAMAAQRCR
ncbi:MAG: hypothetical protein RIA71_05660 [Oceanicaulis sp.]